jgi:hypothetical protein
LGTSRLKIGLECTVAETDSAQKKTADCGSCIQLKIAYLTIIAQRRYTQKGFKPKQERKL